MKYSKIQLISDNSAVNMDDLVMFCQTEME